MAPMLRLALAPALALALLACGSKPAPEPAKPVATDTRSLYERLGGTPAITAVVEEFGSTLPLHPGFTARVDGHGNLVVTA